MTKTCEGCEAALLCIAGLVKGFYMCDGCHKSYVTGSVGDVYMTESPSIPMDRTKCKLRYVPRPIMYVGDKALCTTCRDRLQARNRKTAKIMAENEIRLSERIAERKKILEMGFFEEMAYDVRNAWRRAKRWFR